MQTRGQNDAKETRPGMPCPKCQNAELQVVGTKFLACPECGATYSSSAFHLDDLEERVVQRYPYLIAVPFRSMLMETNTVAKVKCMVDTLTNVLKYLALIVETEYLFADHKDQAVNAIIENDLERPLVSAWNKFLREALVSLERAGHDFFVPEIKALYDQIGRAHV